MATLKRQKQLERQRFERQQQRRADNFLRTKHRQQAITAAATVLAVITAFVIFSMTVKPAPVDPTVRSEQAAADPADQQPNQPPVDIPATAVPAVVEDDGQITCQYYPLPDQPSARPLDGPPASTAPALPATVAATVTINDKPVQVSLQAEKAPCTVRSFIHLAQQEFYDNTPCPRITKGTPKATDSKGLSMVQCGDPSGTRTGGPGYSLGTENLPQQGSVYPQGTLAMANSGSPNSNGSQFFIVYGDSDLPADYSVFGQITNGGEHVTALASGVQPNASDETPPKPITVNSVRITGLE